ncbi:MAG: c-type cytochrome [Spiribacter sp.]|nr:c-type cytochrome [Spiribacter sp.]
MKITRSAALTALALLMLGLPGLAAAEGDISAGRDKAYTCMGCHAVDGYRNAYPSYRVPKLGGQHAEYIVLALKAYKAGDRQHGTMQALASTLSEQDMEDIAAYFASAGQEESE